MYDSISMSSSFSALEYILYSSQNVNVNSGFAMTGGNSCGDPALLSTAQILNTAFTPNKVYDTVIVSDNIITLAPGQSVETAIISDYGSISKFISDVVYLYL